MIIYTKCPCSKEDYSKYDRDYENDPLSSYHDVLPPKDDNLA